MIPSIPSAFERLVGISWVFMRSFAQEKKSQQAPEIDALVRDRKVFAWCHKIN